MAQTPLFINWLTNQAIPLIASYLSDNAAAGTVFGNPTNAAATRTDTSNPALGANGATGGSVTLYGAVSGNSVIGVASSAGTSTFNLPVGNGTTGEVLQTDGSGNTSWVSTTAPNSALLNTIVITASTSTASVSDTTSLTPAYSTYKLILINVIPATDSVSLELLVQSNSSFQTTGYIASATYVSTLLTVTTYIPCSFTAEAYNVAPGISGELTVYNPSNTTMPKMWTGNVSHIDAGGTSVMLPVLIGGMWNGGNTAVTGFQLKWSSGNFTSGTIQVYGYL
jgi:hypothetical protein